MGIQAFGYIGIGSANPDDWSAFATGQMGMQRVDRSGSCRPFRIDDRRQRLIVEKELGEERYFGWEVEDATALDALGVTLEGARVAVRREAASLADQHFVSSLISFHDLAGNRLEAFHGPMLADEPFKPERPISGFRAGPLGMGHVVLMVNDIAAALAFYQGLLLFKMSDYLGDPPHASAMRGSVCSVRNRPSVGEQIAS